MLDERPLTFTEVRQVQAADLGKFELAMHQAGHRGGITVRIDGKWRWVYDIWDDENNDPAAEFGKDSDLTKQILDKVDGLATWVVVRYLVEEQSTPNELEDALANIRGCDLVEVQVPVPASFPAATTREDTK